MTTTPPLPRRVPRFALVASLGLAVAGAIGGGCKKDEPAPSMPTTAEVSAPPPPTVALAPPAEDAADDVVSDARPAAGKPADTSALRACCAALAQNAASMPPPNNLYAANAAAYCTAAVGTVKTQGQRDALFAGIRSAMRGAAMPAACK